jgi:DNA-binding transcriptional LysR family regulator
VELRQLRYFVVVAEELHFRRAAERLFISAPTLSQQIKAVEYEVGAPLLIRHSRGVDLTPAGRALLRGGAEILKAADELLAETRRAAGLAEPVLRLGLLNGIPPALPAMIEDLVRGHEVQLVMTGGPTAEQVVRLTAAETDLALLRSPVTLPSGFRQAPVAREELGLLMSEDSPLAAADAIDVAALGGHELIMFPRELSPGFYDDLLRMLTERGAGFVLSDSAMGFQQVLAILRLRPAAVSVASARAAANPGLAWRPLRGEPLTVTYAVAWRGENRNPVLTSVVQAMSRGLTDVRLRVVDAPAAPLVSWCSWIR